MSKLKDIQKAMEILDITGDKLFERILSDIQRGLYKEAREHLNFVDNIRKADK